MKIQIESVTNGYVVTFPDYVIDGNNEKEVLKQTVFEIPEDSKSKKDEYLPIKYMLYFVLEQLGIFYSKHAPYHLTISVVDNSFKEVCEEESN